MRQGGAGAGDGATTLLARSMRRAAPAYVLQVSCSADAVDVTSEPDKSCCIFKQWPEVASAVMDAIAPVWGPPPAFARAGLALGGTAAIRAPFIPAAGVPQQPPASSWQQMAAGGGSGGGITSQSRSLAHLLPLPAAAAAPAEPQDPIHLPPPACAAHHATPAGTQQPAAGEPSNAAASSPQGLLGLFRLLAERADDLAAAACSPPPPSTSPPPSPGPTSTSNLEGSPVCLPRRPAGARLQPCPNHADDLQCEAGLDGSGSHLPDWLGGDGVVPHVGFTHWTADHVSPARMAQPEVVVVQQEDPSRWHVSEADGMGGDATSPTAIQILRPFQPWDWSSPRQQPRSDNQEFFDAPPAAREAAVPAAVLHNAAVCDASDGCSAAPAVAAAETTLPTVHLQCDAAAPLQTPPRVPPLPVFPERRVASAPPHPRRVRRSAHSNPFTSLFASGVGKHLSGTGGAHQAVAGGFAPGGGMGQARSAINPRQHQPPTLQQGQTVSGVLSDFRRQRLVRSSVEGGKKEPTQQQQQQQQQQVSHTQSIEASAPALAVDEHAELPTALVLQPGVGAAPLWHSGGGGRKSGSSTGGSTASSILSVEELLRDLAVRGHADCSLVPDTVLREDLQCAVALGQVGSAAERVCAAACCRWCQKQQPHYWP